MKVASVPAAHVYVRHLEPLPDPLTGPGGARPGAVGAVVRLPDPDPDHPGRDDRTARERWWPPVMLQPAWVARQSAGAFDLMHLHFGYDDASPARLASLVAALRERRTPLVLTLHDLRNPHHLDAELLHAQLDVLVPAADALLTLTPKAADTVATRWGRRPLVVPHPHVVDLTTMARLRAERTHRDPGRAFRVGVSIKSLRANTDPLRLLPTLLDTIADLPHARLVVDLHRDLLERTDPGAVAVLSWLAAARSERRTREILEVDVHERLDDDALWRRLADLDAAVLPYRFGTHSGWLEACRDLGTAVVAPSFGCYADQGAEHVYAADEQQLDETTLAEAVRRAHADRHRSHGWTVAGRRAQREQVAAAHHDVYSAVLSRTAVGV